jgi:hypothetical protein
MSKGKDDPGYQSWQKKVPTHNKAGRDFMRVSIKAQLLKKINYMFE